MANTKYYILEREVDKETFDKYKDQKFEIGGHKKNLLGLKIWATSSDVAEACPEEAAEARVIYERILSEISKAAPQRKQTFHSFLDELQTIYREEMAAYNSAQNAFDIAEKEYRATMSDNTASELVKQIARGDYARASLDHTQGKNRALDSYNARVKELRKQMADFAADVYRATPDRIDQNAMQLLNTGILSPEEMDHLASQFRDNPPMMRIIGSYAKKKMESTPDWDHDSKGKYRILTHKLNSVTDSEDALVYFDNVAKYGREGMGGDTVLARIHESHWDSICNNACKSYDNFIVQPGSSKE